MKYIKRFSKVSDYETFRGGGEYITPNISLIDDGKRVYSEKKVNNESNLITFRINNIEYQAEEGMTWAEWCDSKYNSIGLYVLMNVDSGGSLISAYGVLYNTIQNNMVHSSEKISKENIYYFLQSGGSN